MFSVHSNSIPDTFQTMFSKNFETHHYATRQANNYKVYFSYMDFIYYRFLQYTSITHNKKYYRNW